MTLKTIHLSLTTLIATALVPVGLCSPHAIKADFVTSQHQALPNGSSIDNSTTGTYIRDANGRTHVDIGGLIAIADPVAGVVWQIDKTSRVASRRSIGSPHENRGERTNALQFGETVPQVAPLSTPALLATSPAQPSDLGTTIINDVLCSGNLWRHVIPVGQVGNTVPLETTVEVWTAEVEGIRLPILVKTNDGMGRTSAQELRNVRTIIPKDHVFAPGDTYRIIDIDETPSVWPR